MRSLAIIGTRPQFIKHAMFERACKGKIDLINVHTDQHFDDYMSQVFIDQLGLGDPKYKVISKATSSVKQTSIMMNGIEEILLKEKPDNVILYGDTNTTLAGAIVASKHNIAVVHIEAGLRSFNKSMPEEINRITTDHIAEYLFCPSDTAKDNLYKEGIVKNVFMIGDVMKDLTVQTLENKLMPPAKLSDKYYFASLHRPYNVDDGFRLITFLEAINKLTYKVLFSLHPRTRNAFETFNIDKEHYKNIFFLNPLTYFDTMSAIYHSQGVITDSGGLQKETYWLHKKCATLRSETEWVETLANDSNKLFWNDLSGLNEHLLNQHAIWDDSLYGDGHASEKIVEHLISNT